MKEKQYQILKWTTRILAAAIIVFALPLYFGYFCKRFTRETLEIRYQAKPCEHTPFEGVALDDHVASVQAHNNRFNNSSGHRYGHSAAWKKPRKRRAGTGYSFRPEIPSLPAGAGNVFFSEDG